MPHSLPPLNGLRAFEAAARHGSFTRAADELHVTQTAISHQIRKLEEQLGVRLFVRTPGAVQGILFLALFPLTFGASTFVPVESLPSWLQTFTAINPMSHLVDSLRGLLLGGAEASDILWTLGSMGAILAVFVPLALRAYGRRA